MTQKWECFGCGRKFKEPKTVDDSQFHGAEIGWERLTARVCPFCGSDEIGDYWYDEEEGEEDDDDDEF